MNCKLGKLGLGEVLVHFGRFLQALATSEWSTEKIGELLRVSTTTIATDLRHIIVKGALGDIKAPEARSLPDAAPERLM